MKLQNSAELASKDCVLLASLLLQNQSGSITMNKHKDKEKEKWYIKYYTCQQLRIPFVIEGRSFLYKPLYTSPNRKLNTLLMHST